LGSILVAQGENTLSLSKYLNAFELSKTISFLPEEEQFSKNIGAV